MHISLEGFNMAAGKKFNKFVYLSIFKGVTNTAIACQWLR